MIRHFEARIEKRLQITRTALNTEYFFTGGTVIVRTYTSIHTIKNPHHCVVRVVFIGVKGGCY